MIGLMLLSVLGLGLMASAFDFGSDDDQAETPDDQTDPIEQSPDTPDPVSDLPPEEAETLVVTDLTGAQQEFVLTKHLDTVTQPYANPDILRETYHFDMGDGTTLEYLLEYDTTGTHDRETVQDFTLDLTDGDDHFDIATDDLEIDLFDENGDIIGADGHGLSHISGGAGDDTIITDINTLIVSDEDDGVDHYTIRVDQAGLDAFEPANYYNPIDLMVHWGGGNGIIQSPGFEDHVTVDLADDIDGYVHQVNYTTSFPTHLHNEGSALVGVLVTDTPVPTDPAVGDYHIYEAVLLHYWTFASAFEIILDDEGNSTGTQSFLEELQLASLTFTGSAFDTIEPLVLPSTNV